MERKTRRQQNRYNIGTFLPDNLSFALKFLNQQNQNQAQNSSLSFDDD